LIEKPYANWDEFLSRVSALAKLMPYELEWVCAISAGWEDEEFEKLYREYVRSTQIKLKPKDDANKLKGRPLEKLARYFLEKGGLITEIGEINEIGRWQVDGYGPVNRTSVLYCWSEEKLLKIGPQVYMEAKNHSSPVEKHEFSDHYRRMDEHHCNLGVMISTSGYKVGRGRGIAESIYINSLTNKFHILLVFQSMRDVILRKKPPMAILTKALLYAFNNSYVNDRDVQESYSKKECQLAVLAEYARLFSPS
jgi:hypothetical protein